MESHHPSSIILGSSGVIKLSRLTTDDIVCSLCCRGLDEYDNGSWPWVLDAFYDEAKDEGPLCNVCRDLCSSLTEARDKVLNLVDQVSSHCFQNKRLVPQRILSKLFQLEEPLSSKSAEEKDSSSDLANFLSPTISSFFTSDKDISPTSLTQLLALTPFHPEEDTSTSTSSSSLLLRRSHFVLDLEEPVVIPPPPPPPLEENKKDRRHHSCLLCPKAFKTSRDLRNHTLSHSKEKPFVCPICGLSYRQKKGLDVHVGLHRGETPYSCPHCQKVFTQKVSLTRHLPLHTREPSWVCHLCGKGFLHHSSFAVHKKGHEGRAGRKFVCEVCPRAFFTSSNLKRHAKKHDKPTTPSKVQRKDTKF